MLLHEKIRAVRRARGIGQNTIAKELNITVQSYSMKETGKRPITTNELEIISDVLGVSASNFFENEFNLKLNNVVTA